MIINIHFPPDLLPRPAVRMRTRPPTATPPGSCTVVQRSKDAEAIEKWYSALGVPLQYSNENLPHASRRALNHLLRSEREYLGWQERAELRAAQQGKCAICDEALGRDAEVDHILALENLGTNAKENFNYVGVCDI